MTVAVPPRSWKLAAVIGWAAVAAPLAAAFAVWRFVETQRLGRQLALLHDGFRADPAAPGFAAVQALIGFTLVSAAFGLPVALPLAGAMARLEQGWSGARRVRAWWVGALVAASPLVALFAWGFGWYGTAVAFGLALIGATVAWGVRHLGARA